jgi:hypothetical protein
MPASLSLVALPMIMTRIVVSPVWFPFCDRFSGLYPNVEREAVKSTGRESFFGRIYKLISRKDLRRRVLPRATCAATAVTPHAAGRKALGSGANAAIDTESSVMGPCREWR